MNRLNALLASINVPIVINSIDECVPSLWIALYEGLLEERLPDIDRSADTSPATRIHNTEQVLRALEMDLQQELSHLKPFMIVSGDEKQILNLIDIFWQLHQAMSQQNSPSVSPIPQQEPVTLLEANLEETPKALKIQPSDTPHMKALKSKRKQLISKQLEQAKKSHKDMTNGKVKLRDLLGKKMELPEPQESSIEEPVNYSTQAEHNLAQFQSDISKIAHVTQGQETRLWNEEINLWKRALKDRLWTQQVVLQKELEFLDDQKAFDFVENETKKMESLAAKSEQQKILQQVKAEYNERHRRVKRMNQYTTMAQETVERTFKKEALKKEKVANQLQKEFLKAQRQALVEQRQLERETRLKMDQDRKKRQEAEKHYLKDQINMLNEELEKQKQEELIAEKAAKEEIRRLEKEQKQLAVKKIDKIKQKLAVDWDDPYQEEYHPKFKVQRRKK